MTVSKTISTLRKRGWTISGPRPDYLDDDPPPLDLPDVKVIGYRVKSPKMNLSYHTAAPMTIANMEKLEKWILEQEDRAKDRRNRRVRAQNKHSS